MGWQGTNNINNRSCLPWSGVA